MPELHSALLDCFQAWKANQDASQWSFAPRGKKQLLFAHSKGEKSKQLKAIQMPKALRLEPGVWRVGWEHRHNGSLKDPLEDLANSLIDLLNTGKLRNVIVVVQKGPVGLVPTANAMGSVTRNVVATPDLHQFPRGELSIHRALWNAEASPRRCISRCVSVPRRR